MDGLLSIGEFSARCGLSAKMLRSYAAVGLLVPAAVDAWSGYRYYSTAQLHQARIVALLRRAGIAVDDMAGFFADPDANRLEQWDREITHTSATRRQALAEARAALAPTQGSDVASTLAAAMSTDQGGQETNQDASLVDDALFAVADGIGALADSDVASRLALDTLGAGLTAERNSSRCSSGDSRSRPSRSRTARHQDRWLSPYTSGRRSLAATPSTRPRRVARGWRCRRSRRCARNPRPAGP